MRPLKEGSPHELYLRSSSAAKPMAPLKLYANVTGKFTVERELRDKVTDKVRLHTQVAEQQRTERKVQMLDTPPAIARANGTGKKRKAPANSAFPSSSSSSLLKRAAHNDMRNASTSVPSRVASPLPPTSTPPPSTAKESSARRRMVQYVAITHRLPEDVVRALGGPDCDSSTRRMLLDLLDEVRIVIFILVMDLSHRFHRLLNQMPPQRKATKLLDRGHLSHGHGLKYDLMSGNLQNQSVPLWHGPRDWCLKV